MPHCLTDAEIAEVAERLHSTRPKRFQGFSHGLRFWIRDVSLRADAPDAIVWRGTDHSEMMAYLRFLYLRAALAPFRKD